MKKWKQLLVTGLLAVTMTLSAMPVYADEQVSTSTTSESTVQTDSTNIQDTDSITNSHTTEVSPALARASDPSTEKEQDLDESQETENTDSAVDSEVSHEPTVSYDVHVQNNGWMLNYSSGQTGGTTGQALRMEAMRVYLNSDGADLGIHYRAHVQNIGWESTWHNNGEQAGTTGQALRMEAVQMQLTGADAADYDLYFRVHVQNIGWLGWAEAAGGNSAIAGTTGAAYRVEAIQIAIVKAGEAAPAADGQVTGVSYLPADDINYQAHVQGSGWQNPVKNGITAGITGQGLRMEALRITTDSPSVMGFQYRSHVQNIGWETTWHNAGDIAGTTGQSLRMEAVQIQLTGEMARFFDVCYRVHVQNIGWMGWARNGESAGTIGASLRVEAIQICLVPSGANAPSTAGQVTSVSYVPTNDITYQAHMQGTGWQSPVSSGATAGDVNGGRQMEALKISTGTPSAMGFQYRSHIQNIGWEGNWHNTGDVTGTTGQSLRMEAVQIKLTGESARFFDVYYRVYVQNNGWMGWAKNGDPAGTQDLALRIEGIQIVLRCKGADAPGSTANAFKKKPSVRALYPLACQRLDQVGWNLHSALNAAANMRYVSTSFTMNAQNIRPMTNYGFTTGGGDCYVMAACFYEMAKALGYDAHVMFGYVPLRSGGLGDHAWVEIDNYQGRTMVFDPDFQHESGNDGFAIYYGKPGTWRYTSGQRVN